MRRISKAIVPVLLLTLASCSGGSGGAPTGIVNSVPVTEMVDGINPGPGTSWPEWLCGYEGQLYFSAYDGVNWAKFWKTDGTVGGTNSMNISELTSPGGGPGGPIWAAAGGLLFFSGTTPGNGSELWRTDGTTQGTMRVWYLIPGTGTPYLFRTLGSNLIFVTSGGSNQSGGDELWISDGTESGTIILVDIFPGNKGSYPEELTVIDQEIYFEAQDSANNRELWKTDGTSWGTVLVKDINPEMEGGGADIRYITKAGAWIYFACNDGLTGYELWKTDGSPSGTTEQVKDIYPGTSSGIPTLGTEGAKRSQLIAHDNLVYFPGITPLEGIELWKSDGTLSGTVMVKNINPTGDSGLSNTYMNLISVGNSLFFFATDGVNGRELWKSDGSSAGTVMVKNINTSGDGVFDAGPSHIIGLNGILYFIADDGVHGVELWKSDGTEAGTVMVMDINTSGNSDPRDLTPVGNTLYFVADDGINGTELWKHTE